MRNLEAYVERADPDDFYSVMEDLKKAKAEVLNVALAFERAQRKWDIERGWPTTNEVTQA